MTFLKVVYIHIFLIIFVLSTAYAQDRGAGWCGSIFKSVQVGCNDLARSNTVGGSYPLLFDAFNVNPASLPNFPTPVGVEAFMANSRVNYSLIKGLDGVGFGTSVASTKNTFFSPTSNLETTFIEQTTGQNAGGSFDPNLNFGTSFALLGQKGSPIQSSLGVSAKYNKEYSDFDLSSGLVLKTKFLSLGVNYIEKNDGEIILAYSAGLKLHKLVVDYTYFEAKETYTIVTKILSINYKTGGLQITYAYRRQVNPFVTEVVREAYLAQGNEYNERHGMLGVSYRYNERFTIGYYTNYVLDQGSSLTVQYIF